MVIVHDILVELCLRLFELGDGFVISVQNCTAFELAAFIIYRYGAGTAKKLLDKNFFYSCKTRADGIARERHDRYQ